MADFAPILICDVTATQFSIARHYGGIKICGKMYLYKPERDILIREDWDKAYRNIEWNTFVNAVKTGVKPAIPKRITKKEAINNNTKSLFD